MAVSFKGAHCPPEVTRMGVRWYFAYPLSTRHVEELMAERGVNVDHSTVNRWRKFLNKAMGRHDGTPEKIAIDGSATNEAAIKSDNKEHGASIEIRKTKYLSNIVEQDHRGVKRMTRPMLGFKVV